MTTVELDAWFLSHGSSVADGTKIVNRNFRLTNWIHFLDTFWLKAWHALGFSSAASAWVTAR
tara:strand:- start:127 stop:312 length:186 start_codon:yes stop_codon:yes gene_type:complete